MQLRRALPLTLAALVMATGCVTVHPAAPPDPPRLAPAAAPAEPPQQTVAALPLGTLPAAPEPESEPAAPAPAPARVPSPAAARPKRPKPAAKPAPVKPRARKPAPAKAPPAPRRTFDMAPLCAAARGTVSPDIVALCR
ncbi:hypothetical protein [Streptomyces sp. NPDC091371]|uniref:hypothetical protein n=1 Tax=Streptomyces sp. NPDC091371 TaxID=3155303 RepID=UPI003442D99B